MNESAYTAANMDAYFLFLHLSIENTCTTQISNQKIQKIADEIGLKNK